MKIWVGILSILILPAAPQAGVFDSLFGGSDEPSVQAETDPALNPFVIKAGPLKNNFDFWIRIYTELDSGQGLMHDSEHIEVVYEKLDLRNMGGREGNRYYRERKRYWQKVLASVHEKQKKPETFTDDEKHVFELFQKIDEPNKFLRSAQRRRIRFQRGQSNYFKSAIYESGKYQKKMDEIFIAQGLPIELTRLPFVESSFNLRARSKVGASGIWQFMPSTGRLYMRVDRVLDERNDPIRATEAAARKLKENFETLGAWPIAVTAYNHGRMGMLRAVRQVGSNELEKIIQYYNSRKFGFASSNFFLCLAAAIEVEKNAEKYFGKIERAQPLEYFEVKLPDYIAAKHLRTAFELSSREFEELNPGLSSEVFRDQYFVPKGYWLRIPSKWAGPVTEAQGKTAFDSVYERIPASYKYTHQVGGASRGRRR